MKARATSTQSKEYLDDNVISSHPPINADSKHFTKTRYNKKIIIITSRDIKSPGLEKI